jgi:hypothetical protein
MLQVRSPLRLDQIETALRLAAERHGAEITAVSRLSPDALTFTLFHTKICTPLLAADTRFAAFLPLRVAACAQGETTTLEALTPREFCRLLKRPEFEPAVVPLDEVLNAILKDAARSNPSSSEHTPTEEQVNMQAEVPQRIDPGGTKVEEVAGVGGHDSQGG